MKAKKSVKDVVTVANAAATEAMNASGKVKPEDVTTALIKALRSRDAMAGAGDEAKYQVRVTVTNFRLRSAFNAVMFGFMAGADSIDGTVAVQDLSGKVLKQVDVSASYAAGGFAGGQDSVRIEWMLDEFSKKAIEELVKTPVKG
ncbi:DUF4410 domain-containing protein [Niveibacterium sp.]|uniref:DUF4410 domain-containing protein n=1 Tax=Niveibacterium sp. TaxID=2017444 RepID=UPI0035AEB0E9